MRRRSPGENPGGRFFRFTGNFVLNKAKHIFCANKTIKKRKQNVKLSEIHKNVAKKH